MGTQEELQTLNLALLLSATFPARSTPPTIGKVRPRGGREGGEREKYLHTVLMTFHNNTVCTLFNMVSNH